MHTSRSLRRLAVLTLALASSACFATREDLRVLQNDLATMRAEATRADSAHREQLRQTQRAVAGVADTLKGQVAMAFAVLKDASAAADPAVALFKGSAGP